MISLGAHNGTPDRQVVMDQANRQLNLIPVPVAEYDALGSAVLSTFGVVAVIVGVIVGVSLLAGAVVLIVLLRRRRPQQAYTPVASPRLNLSPDRRYWWDGQRWIDGSSASPPFAPRSADGGYWWDGWDWRPVPQTLQPPAGGR